MQSVVVTGASTGIGWGAVKILTEAGFHVFGSVRKKEDADRLAGEFGAKFTALMFDVTDAAAIADGARTVASALKNETLFGLVNNAGIAVPGPLLYVDADDFRRQLEVNVTGQLLVTQAFAPLLGVDPSRQGPKGRIVMITSVGGRRAFPFNGPYSASKFALEGMSEALRRELMIFGIDVVVIAPGPVATKIWDKAEAEDITRFGNTPYSGPLVKLRDFMLAMGRNGLSPEHLGQSILRALTTEKPRTRYVETNQKLQQFMLSILPPRTIDRQVAKQLGLKP